MQLYPSAYLRLLEKALAHWQGELSAELAQISGLPAINATLTQESDPVKQQARARVYTDHIEKKRMEAEKDVPNFAPLTLRSEDVAFFNAILRRYRNSVLAEYKRAIGMGISKVSLADAENVIKTINDALKERKDNGIEAEKLYLKDPNERFGTDYDVKLGLTVREDTMTSRTIRKIREAREVAKSLMMLPSTPPSIREWQTAIRGLSDSCLDGDRRLRDFIQSEVPVAASAKLREALGRLGEAGNSFNNGNDARIAVGRDLVLVDRILEAAEKSASEEGAISAEKVGETTVRERTMNSRKVFVVHGHDEEAKQTVARFLEKIDLEVIILHEQPNRGRTIIEKFEDYSDVAYAVVLLTGDDVGIAKKDLPSWPLSSDEQRIDTCRLLRDRSRQNVVLELGYFMGKLDRGRVAALTKGDVEIPSDYGGVLWISMDEDWRKKLAQEMDEVGIEIDFKKVVKS